MIVCGTSVSRIPPKAYTYLFVTCDFISLVLQAAGGGIASSSASNSTDPKLGIHVMLAGLGSQVFTLSIFIILCIDYAVRVYKNKAVLSQTHEYLRSEPRFKRFLLSLAAATVFIFARSVYRIAELSEGFHGKLAGNQPLFFVLEGV